MQYVCVGVSLLYIERQRVNVTTVTMSVNNDWGLEDDEHADYSEPRKDLAKVWSWVVQLDSLPKPDRQHLFDLGKCKVVLGCAEEGEKYGLHVGGLSCYSNTVRKAQVVKTVQFNMEKWGNKDSHFQIDGIFVGYCEPAKNSGKQWVRHNFKNDVAKYELVKQQARDMGWNLYWMRSDDSATSQSLKISENIKLVEKWFDDYKAAHEDEKPTYEQYKADLFNKFHAGVYNLEKCTKGLYDDWKPKMKRSWLSTQLSKLPDESPLVKHMRLEMNYEKTARALTKWTIDWQVYSDQNDYLMRDNSDDMNLYVVLMALLTRTSSRDSSIKTHGLWICGEKGYGKSVLTEFIAGIKSRRKKVAGDSKGVGRFKCNDFQEVVILDDIRAESYRQQDYYQTVNQLLDNTGTEVKIHSSSVSLSNKYVLINSNERIIELDAQRETEANKDPNDKADAVVIKGKHPLRRRVIEVRINKPMPKCVIDELTKINNDEDFKGEGDKLMWRWWYEYSKRIQFEEDKRLQELQRLVDKQCEEEYNFSRVSPDRQQQQQQVATKKIEPVYDAPESSNNRCDSSSVESDDLC